MPEIEEEGEKKTEVRHTITAEETFTLAKDVYDIRCFIKNVYNNRAVIKRRINIVSLAVSLLFTFFYLAYIVYVGISQRLNLGTEIMLYVLLGVYAALVIALLVVTAVFSGNSTGGAIKASRMLHVFRFIARVLAIGISIAALALDFTELVKSPSVALSIIVIVFSIMTLIFQALLLIAGGIAGFARWLISPVKSKKRFSFVILEWYETAVPREKKTKKDKPAKRLNEKYAEDVGRCIDSYILPELGKKYVTAIKASGILTMVANTPEQDKALVGGILKSVFAYAEECGYVNLNPCRSLELGDIEVEEKPKRTFRQRLFGIGARFAKKKIDEFIEESVVADDVKKK